MGEAVAIATAGVFALLSAVHVYWAAGGASGKSLAVPEREGRPLFRPSRSATIFVALLLASASVVVAWGPKAAIWAAALVMGIRAVGDGKWIGFFKSSRGTAFAKLDTLVYSPLCLGLCLACSYIALKRS